MFNKTYKSLTAAVLLLSAAGGCSPLAAPGSSGEILVRIRTDAPSRALSTYDDVQAFEQQIQHLQILMFDNAGNLTNYVSATGTDTVRIRTGSGPRRLLAFANAPSMAHVRKLSESACYNEPIPFADYNGPAGLAMHSAGGTPVPVTVPADGSPVPCTLLLERYAVRVALKEVHNELAPALGAVRLVRAWLTHIPTLVYSGGSTGSDLFDAGEEHLLSHRLLNTEDLTPETPWCFYCYPGSSARLIIETRINGSTYYYPLALGPLVANHTYDVALTLRNLGSTDPDTPLRPGTCRLQVSVKDWTSGEPIIESL